MAIKSKLAFEHTAWQDRVRLGLRLAHLVRPARKESHLAKDPRHVSWSELAVREAALLSFT